MGSRSNYDDKVRSFPAEKQPTKRVVVPVKQKPDGSYEAAGKPRAGGPRLRKHDIPWSSEPEFKKAVGKNLFDAGRSMLARKAGLGAADEAMQEGAQAGAMGALLKKKERRLTPKDGPVVTLKTDHYKLKSGKKWE